MPVVVIIAGSVVVALIGLLGGMVLLKIYQEKIDLTHLI